ncbi:MAG: lipoyl synthase [Chloroflexi bacterium]|nr:lipoyl synthase [Chloroflexota bacterium]
MSGYARRPEWLKLTPLNPAIVDRMRALTRDLKLHTVCDSARCPNRTRCFGRQTAAFIILGETCTRHCAFCAMKSGRPGPPDPQEGEHIVDAVTRLELRYVVVTSVTRDDLTDGGASQFAQVISAIHEYDADIPVEVLVPDFGGSFPALQTVAEASPAVLNHNVETVPRLYPEVRPQAKYERSLELLKRAKLLNSNLLTKSGFMLGLGETRQEIIRLMEDLKGTGCDLLTIGQYLQPSLKHREVARFLNPEEFAEYEKLGEQLGFRRVASGPLVRSSFHASEMFL